MALTDRIQLGQTSSSTAEKTNYLKHTDSSSISYKDIPMEHWTIYIPVISFSSVYMADSYLGVQS